MVTASIPYRIKEEAPSAASPLTRAQAFSRCNRVNPNYGSPNRAPVSAATMTGDFLSRGESQDENDDFHLGEVSSVNYERRVIFFQLLELNRDEMPKWEPTINIDDDFFSDDDLDW